MFIRWSGDVRFPGLAGFKDRHARGASPTNTAGGSAFGGSVVFGPFTYEVDLLRVYEWGDGTIARIGSYCSIASGVELYLGGGHRTDWISTYPFGRQSLRAERPGDRPGHPTSSGDILIGNDVWIGSNASIMSGVHVGDGAVIAARSHVVSNIPAYSIAGGNPAQVIRPRFDDRTTQRLLAVAWWEWSPEAVWAAREVLCSTPTEGSLETLEIITAEERRRS